MSLEAKIEELKVQFSHIAPIEIQKLFEEETEKLKATKISDRALKVGDTVTNAVLKDVNANSVELFDYVKKSDYLVLNFYRGGWCPYCNLELKAFQDKLLELKALNASLVAISPEKPDLSLTTQEKNSLEFDVLSDLGNKVSKSFGLVFSLAPSLRPIYKEFGIDIIAHNGDENYEIPMPATYVINKDKKIIYSFVQEDYTKRAEPLDVINAIKGQK
jgi:peroxiredoxin